MRRKGVSYAKYGYFFCIPFVLAYLIFSFYPTIYTTVIGFTDLKGIGRTDFNILDNPFRNFEIILKNPSFQKSLGNTAMIWIANFIPQIGLALLLTAWFTSHRRKIKGQGFFKVLFYMPNIITAATIAILFATLFGYPTGPVNSLFQDLGWSDGPIYFLMNKWTARGVIAFIQFWMWYGYTMIVLIAGVLGINPELFEASEIDGATGAQTFFHVTLPNLRTIMLFTLVTSLIGGLQMFDIPKLFQNGGPDSSTLTTSAFIYNQAFSGSYLYNRAAAASMIMFIIIAACSSILFYILRDRDAIKLNKQIKQQQKELRKAEKAARREE
ncbi:sugar ABC transporter permease [Mobilitalea sibirica]|uniref:Sugar ABC transporter permease n=1 Tax=Mobilitalea sibirica TaxID=1462919 RepID=A0A8J7H109_9FIRM|nr:sugar ABC transporter permease [Mobilitalea sibirica]MBH1939959.1 sugar ABC transporter permease [Mobilitalea sibirica]